MARWMYLLLLAVPAVFIAEMQHASALLLFVLAALGLIPLAGLIGLATEVLAERLGHGIGGLLNATFGNAAEIIIGLAALGAGLPEVVRASLAGSIIGNALLVLGTAMLLGGWRYRRQLFSARVAGEYASMLALAVIGMGIPSLLATVGESSQPGGAVIRGSQLHLLSIGVALVLLACYVAYIAYAVFGLRAVREEPVLDSEIAIKGGVATHKLAYAQVPIGEEEPVVNLGRGFFGSISTLWHHSLWLPLLVLAGVTAVTAFASEILVGTIEPLTHQVGLNPFFVGLIIIPIVGNAAEHFSAVTSAMHDHMEISLAITAGSSIQIALLAAPILVLAGALMGVPLDLNFSLLEVSLFALVAFLYALISLDGESTWLEGLLLCAFYLILAVGTFFRPS